MTLPLGYHFRSLFARKATTILTLLVIAAVIAVLTWILGFSAAMGRSMSIASDDRKIIVIRRGSESETNSAILPDEMNRLTQITGVARDASGAAVISPELMVQASLPRRRDGGRTRANIAVRGVTEMALLAHPIVRLNGPMVSKSEPEVVVGQRAAEQFDGLAIGSTIKLGVGNNRDYRVVGTFTADGGPLESEIWGYLPSLQDAFRREGVYSSATLRLAPGTNAKDVADTIKGPSIGLSAEPEPQYWARQSKFFDAYKFTGIALVLIIAVAAAIAIANTMFAVVAGRSREIAMLRTIGFSKGSILLGFVIEAVMLSLLGGLLGVALCAGWLAIAGNKKDMFGATTFTTLAFDVQLTPVVVALSMVAVCIVGAAGALAPAIRASRLEPVTALREA